jgi:cytochrome c-type biogenesis protein CcmH
MIMRFIRFALLVVIALASTPALAVQPDEVMKDPALEARARALSAELRCLVCQNQKNLAARTNFQARLASRRR